MSAPTTVKQKSTIAPTPTFATCLRCRARLYITAEGRVFCPNCDSSASKTDGSRP